MTDADYLIEVRQELFGRWMRTAETPSFPATDNAIMYCKQNNMDVYECVNYFLDV